MFNSIAFMHLQSIAKTVAISNSINGFDDIAMHQLIFSYALAAFWGTRIWTLSTLTGAK